MENNLEEQLAQETSSLVLCSYNSNSLKYVVGAAYSLFQGSHVLIQQVKAASYNAGITNCSSPVQVLAISHLIPLSADAPGK